MDANKLPVVEIKNLFFSYPIIRKEKYTKERVLKTFSLFDISFTVKEGESIGIIGRNGSGKSTLAKIISGVYLPDSGSINLQGKIAPLLELGAGFDHELTAKENIFLYGLLIGISYKSLKSGYKSILNFSGLEKYENYPLRTFSSGMLARLAFAIATSFTPDVLIIDEVLSVGDKEFASMSKSRINSLLDAGSANIVISHDFEAIRTLTKTCIWLENGRIKNFGNSDHITKMYISEMR